MSIYRVVKKLSAFLAVSVWIALIIKIFQSGGGFNAQLPKCIFTTMITFGILTAIYKYIEYLESQDSSNSQKDTDKQRE